MFSAPCFTLSSMLSCFSSPARRLSAAAARLWLPGDCGASVGAGKQLHMDEAQHPKPLLYPAHDAPSQIWLHFSTRQGPCYTQPQCSTPELTAS